MTDYTRREVIRTLAIAAGGVILRPDLDFAADPPNSQPTDQPDPLLSADSGPLRLGPAWAYPPDARQEHPTLTLDPDRPRLWTTWTAAGRRADCIWLRSFDLAGERWDEPRPVTSDDDPVAGPALDSATAFYQGKLIVVWSQAEGRGWRLLARAFDPAGGASGPVRSLAGGADHEVHWRPVLAALPDALLLVWQARRGARQPFEILGQLLEADGSPRGALFEVSRGSRQDCCRPALVASAPAGRFAAAFDRQVGPGNQEVQLVLLDGHGRPQGDALPVSDHPASDLAPDLAFTPDARRLWIAWHTNRRDDAGWDLPRWYRLAALELPEMTWRQPAECAPPDLDSRGQIQGFEFAQVLVTPQGGVCVLGRRSHSFNVQSQGATGSSPRHRLPPEGWGGRGRNIRGLFDSAGRLWVTRRDLQHCVLQSITGVDTGTAPPRLAAAPAPRSAARPPTPCTEHFAWPVPALPSPAASDQAVPAEPLHLYFGDIHGHSYQSDGMGDPEESYLRARDIFNDDFHVLTDHTRFVGKRLLDAQWEQQKNLADHYLQPGRFVTFYGQEWTTPPIGSPSGWGHFNVYSADPAIPLLDTADERFAQLPDVLAALPGWSAIAIPHHIGWTGVRWDVWNPDLIPVVEICSVHGAFEYLDNKPIPHRGRMAGSFVRDGLAAGLHFGLVGGSDQHGLIWHHGICWKRNAYRAGLTGVWATDLSRPALLAALRTRRTFATSGVKLSLRFAINGALMGSVVPATPQPRIELEVVVPPAEGRLKGIEIIRNGLVLHRSPAEGQEHRLDLRDEQCDPASGGCYYARVELDNREMAWSSPVWLSPAPPRS